MRIVAGRFRGRRIEAPKGRDTRPTTDRVREALFSTLSSLDALEDARVLDPYAGSGALGLEALSRGARIVTFIDRDRAALEALRSNVAALGVERDTRVLAGEAGRLLERAASTGGPFSLLMLDPPYKIDPAEVRGVLQRLVDANALADGAFVVWEHAAGDSPSWPDGFSVVVSKRYGSTEVDVAEYERGVDAE